MRREGKKVSEGWDYTEPSRTANNFGFWICIQQICTGRVNLFICARVRLFFQDLDVMEQGV